MWIYEKKLQYPAKVGKADLKMAKYLITQYGGPDGELGAALRYLNQRYTMPTGVTKGILNDIGTEELAHLEIIATLVYKLTKALFYVDATGNPWTAAYIQAKGDPVADLHEDMAAEEKARATYQWLIDLTDDPDLKDTLNFLRVREIVHFQRFGEALDMVQEELNSKHVY
jgi:spore coat protein JC